jgi:hypothetical protein
MLLFKVLTYFQKFIISVDNYKNQESYTLSKSKML